LLLALLLVLARPDSASAYIDPGTTSYLFQLLLAGLLACALGLRIFWRSVKDFVSRLFNGRRVEGGESKDEDQ
jgi:hypothetical protein